MMVINGERDINSLPKAQLHLHLTGAMRLATLLDLAARYGVPTPPEWDHSAAQEWAAFQSRYDAARSVIRSAADAARVVLEAAEDDHASGCGWMEIQVDPTSYAPVLGGMEAAIEAILAAAASAPIPTAVIIASSWARSAEHAETLARLAIKYASSGVVGFGLSNDERGSRIAEFIPACRLAAEHGLIVTPHSGFYTGPDHVRDCIELLGASRIGHGTSAVTDPPLLDMLAERAVTLEICPSSYPPLGIHEPADVPVKTLLDAGVRVALGSDDPLIFGVNLAGQFAVCRDPLGLDDMQLATLARHSIEASAATEPVKQRLTSAVEDWLGHAP